MSPKVENKKLLTPKDAAGLASVSRRTLRRWEDDGLITGIKTATGNRRYTEESVLAAMNGSGDAGGSPISVPKESVGPSRRAGISNVSGWTTEAHKMRMRHSNSFRLIKKHLDM